MNREDLFFQEQITIQDAENSLEIWEIIPTKHEKAVISAANELIEFYKNVGNITIDEFTNQGKEILSKSINNDLEKMAFLYNDILFNFLEKDKFKQDFSKSENFQNLILDSRFIDVIHQTLVDTLNNFMNQTSTKEMIYKIANSENPFEDKEIQNFYSQNLQLEKYLERGFKQYKKNEFSNQTKLNLLAPEFFAIPGIDKYIKQWTQQQQNMYKSVLQHLKENPRSQTEINIAEHNQRQFANYAYLIVHSEQMQQNQEIFKTKDVAKVLKEFYNDDVFSNPQKIDLTPEDKKALARGEKTENIYPLFDVNNPQKKGKLQLTISEDRTIIDLNVFPVKKEIVYPSFTEEKEFFNLKAGQVGKNADLYFKIDEKCNSVSILSEKDLQNKIRKISNIELREKLQNLEERKFRKFLNGKYIVTDKGNFMTYDFHNQKINIKPLNEKKYSAYITKQKTKNNLKNTQELKQNRKLSR